MFAYFLPLSRKTSNSADILQHSALRKWPWEHLVLIKCPSVNRKNLKSIKINIAYPKFNFFFFSEISMVNSEDLIWQICEMAAYSDLPMCCSCHEWNE